MNWKVSRHPLPPEGHVTDSFLSPSSSPSASMSIHLNPTLGACATFPLQWTYVTANTCLVDGYRNYNFPCPTWWASHLPDCPYTKNWPRDGSVFPEMFWNCADVRVLPAGSSRPMVAANGT